VLVAKFNTETADEGSTLAPTAVRLIQPAGRFFRLFLRQIFSLGDFAFSPGIVVHPSTILIVQQ
jgi:hypothetical protein